MIRTNRLARAALAVTLVIAPGALLARKQRRRGLGSDTGLQDAVRTLTAQVNAQRTETEGLRPQLAAQDAKAADLQERSPPRKRRERSRAAARDRQVGARQRPGARCRAGAGPRRARGQPGDRPGIAAGAGRRQCRDRGEVGSAACADGAGGERGRDGCRSGAAPERDAGSAGQAADRVVGRAQRSGLGSARDRRQGQADRGTGNRRPRTGGQW